MSERVLVTGVLGCIGAWTAATLVREGVEVVGFDLGGDAARLELVMEPDEVARVTLERGDIGDLAALEAVLDRHGITRVIHLAALQIPFCRADPPRGAYVNVLGTVNVFEAVKRRDRIEGPLVLASSAAVYDPVEPGAAVPPPAEDARTRPATHYGVYKVANEGTARIYWQDDGVPSVALRPFTVYGPARDQGVTAAPTLAIAAAVGGEPFHIPYGGRTQFNYAPDVARALVAAMRSGHQGAATANLRGSAGDIADVVAAVERLLPEARGLLTHGEEPLALPAELQTGAFEELVGGFEWTALEEGVRLTIEHFRRTSSGTR
jgi:nucleoside-diphosphate-sugar epimerase